MWDKSVWSFCSLVSKPDQWIKLFICLLNIISYLNSSLTVLLYLDLHAVPCTTKKRVQCLAWQILRYSTCYLELRLYIILYYTSCLIPWCKCWIMSGYPYLVFCDFVLFSYWTFYLINKLHALSILSCSWSHRLPSNCPCHIRVHCIFIQCSNYYKHVSLLASWLCNCLWVYVLI
jgi:hypothetical protein